MYVIQVEWHFLAFLSQIDKTDFKQLCLNLKQVEEEPAKKVLNCRTKTRTNASLFFIETRNTADVN